MRRAIALLVLSTGWVAVAAQRPTSKPDCNEGVRLSFWKGDQERPRAVTVRSPDGRKSFAVRAGRHNAPVLTITADGKPLRHEVEYLNQAWLLWSPASNAFLIESTSAGSYDGWTTQVFVLNGGRVEEFDVGKSAREDLARDFAPCIPGNELNPSDCDAEHWADFFNVHALQWLSGERLLIAVQIPCSTAYGPNWCKLKTYEVEIPSGRILAAYTQAQAHQRYPKLVNPPRSQIVALTGWVKTDAGRTIILSDEDKQPHNVSNPDALKDCDGRHVKVKAHMLQEDNSLEITSVKMLPDTGSAGDTNK